MSIIICECEQNVEKNDFLGKVELTKSWYVTADIHFYMLIALVHRRKPNKKKITQMLCQLNSNWSQNKKRPHMKLVIFKGSYSYSYTKPQQFFHWQFVFIIEKSVWYSRNVLSVSGVQIISYRKLFFGANTS